MCLYLAFFIPSVHAEDFLYKIQGSWSDIAVYNTTTAYVVNSQFSRVEKYDPSNTSSPYLADWGGFGNGNGTMNQPKGVTVDYEGNVYVVDTGNHRIVKFNSSGTYQTSWGSYGTTTTDFNSPEGATSSASILYVADTGNNRIKLYKTDGTFLSAFGGIGTGSAQFVYPKGIAVDEPNNAIYVADTGNNRIQKFSLTGTYVSAWGTYGTGPATFNQPQKIAVDASGYVYVTDTTNRIQKFDSSGNLQTYWYVTPGVNGVAVKTSTVYVSVPHTQIQSFSLTGIAGSSFTSELQIPKDIHLDSSNNVYLTNGYTNTVQKFSSSFEPLAEWSGTAPGFSTLLGIAVNTGNQVYVIDSGNSRVQKFSNTGTFINTWGSSGTGNSQFANPFDIVIEQNGKSYVVDSGNNRIQKFDTDNSYLSQWGTVGTTLGQFNTPKAIDIDSSNYLYVVDSGNNRIEKFDNVGVGQTAWGSYGSGNGQFDAPTGIKVDESLVYVVDTGNNRVQKFSTAGVYSSKFGVYGSEDGQFVGPTNLAIDSANKLYITDTGNKRIQVFGTASTAAGTTISQSGAVTTVTENGTVDSFSIRLNSQPSSNVTITLTPSSQITLSTSTITFTPYNWNNPQTITVTAVNDLIAEGDHTATISYSVSSSDTNYSPVTITATTVYITDNDTPSVTLSKTSLSVVESGTGSSQYDTYSLVLNSQPTANVTIALTSYDTGRLSVSPTSVVFNSSNWNSAQTIMVSALNDDYYFATSSSTISHVITTSDTQYQSVSIQNAIASITDDDSPALVITQSSGSTVMTEGSTTDSYTLKLNGAPTAGALVSVAIPNTAQASPSANLLTFTSSNWNSAQTVTLTPVNDVIAEGTHSATLTHTTTSTDTLFNNLIATVSATIYDDDAGSLVFTHTDATTLIYEDGANDTYYVKLAVKPESNVTITMDTGSGEATTSPTLLTFTPDDWDTNQLVTVSAPNDFVYQSDTHTVSIAHTATSTSNGYEGVTGNLSLTVMEEGSYQPGVTITQTNGGTQVTEGSSTTDSFTVRLTSRPAYGTYVRINIASSNTEATTSARYLTFTRDNWSTEQTVTISARDDTSSDGTKTTTLSFTVVSSDSVYNGLGVSSVNVTVYDNEPAVATTSSSSAPTGCLTKKPEEVPFLFQVDTTKTTATLYFMPVKENISYYFIAYGYSNGDKRFGASYDFGPYTGVINYTVNMLNPGETYYFTIRGGNGCATGEWSNTLAATTLTNYTMTARGYRSTYATTASSSSGSSGSSSYTFTRDLYVGSRGADVKALQQYLNRKGFIVASSGPGSPGQETELYGGLTASAVRRLQEAYKSTILTPAGFYAGTGIFGPHTRSYVNSNP